MDLTTSKFPTLVAEIVARLEAAGRNELIGQLRSSTICSVSFDDDSDAGYIHIRAGRELNVVEQNIVGVRNESNIGLECESASVVLDLDNFGRVLSIELLFPSQKLKDALRGYLAA